MSSMYMSYIILGNQTSTHVQYVYVIYYTGKSDIYTCPVCICLILYWEIRHLHMSSMYMSYIILGNQTSTHVQYVHVIYYTGKSDIYTCPVCICHILYWEIRHLHMSSMYMSYIILGS